MDLRDFILKCDQIGELKKIEAEVDWNLELSHIAKINEEKKGPALLFQKPKDYDIPVFTSAFTTSKRLALALEMPVDTSMCELSRHWMELSVKKHIP
ncbi:MAG: phenylphosphate carboxylase subunit beta, partial [Desulfocucumaceae bacterium]